MAQAPEVGVIGMRALMRDVTRMGEDGSPLMQKLKDAGRTAAEPVAAAARASYPRESGTLAGDVRVTSAKSGAAVRVGRSSVPYAGPVDFGGWPEGRDYQAGGRALFPAAQSLASSAADLYSKGVQSGIDSFPWTNSGGAADAIHD